MFQSSNRFIISVFYDLFNLENALLEMAKKCITNYYYRYKPFDHGRTIALGERVLINLNGSSDYKMLGYIDKAYKARGWLL